MIDDVQALVELLYRADWMQLSMLADVSELTDHTVYAQMMRDSAPAKPRYLRYVADGGREAAGSDGEAPVPKQSRLLIAPGGKFRHEFSRDGDQVVDAWDGHAEGPWTPPGPPFDELLCPAWLLTQFELRIAGPATVGDRAAIRITGRPRPFARGRSGLVQTARSIRSHRIGRNQLRGDELLDQVVAVVDAELGILLQCERQYGDRLLSRSELTVIKLNPPEAADPLRFEPKPDREADEVTETDSGVDQGAGTPQSGGQTAKTVAKAAAELGVSALAMAIKHAPHRSHGSAGQWHAATEFEEWPVEDTDQAEQSDPVDGHILELLYQSGLRSYQIDAEFHRWHTADAAVLAAQEAGERTSVDSFSKLAEAVSERAVDKHQRAKIEVAGPTVYRIDYADGAEPRRPTIIAADGEQRWRVYSDRVAVGKAAPLPADIAGLLDPAWLLDWKLTGGKQVRFDGRPAYLLRVREPANPSPILSTTPSAAVIDAELGIVVRLTVEYGGRLARRLELHDVTIRPPADAAEFRVEITEETHQVADSGGLLDEADAPAPIKVAADLAGRAVASAAAAQDFAQKFLRGRQGRRPGPR